MPNRKRSGRSVILRTEPGPILIPVRLMGPITEKKTLIGRVYENVRARRKKAKAMKAQEPSKDGKK